MRLIDADALIEDLKEWSGSMHPSEAIWVVCNQPTVEEGSDGVD